MSTYAGAQTGIDRLALFKSGRSQADRRTRSAQVLILVPQGSSFSDRIQKEIRKSIKQKVK